MRFTNLLLLTVIVLLGACAAAPPRTANADCDAYHVYQLPSYARVFNLEPMPPECVPRPPKRLVGYESVTVYDVGTGRTSHVIVPTGTVIVQ